LLQTQQLHPLLPWELFLGDGHYTGLGDVIWPYRKDHDLTEQEVRYNLIHSFYRARVEHTIRRIKSHSIISSVYRGNYKTLSDAVKVLVHTTNTDAKTNLKYPPLGPWDHN